MRLPFTTAEFLGLFEQYHAAVGAMPLALTALALLGVFVVWKGTHRASAIMSAILVLLWLWSGIVYHWVFFTTLNPAAWGFGALFVAQGILLAVHAVRNGGLRFVSGLDPVGLAGWIVMLYALALYPLLGGLAGHGYPAGPSFGAPCPTTLFTLGALLWVRSRVPRALLVIPLAWAAIGTTAALQLRIVEDFGLVLAALVVMGVLVWQRGHPLAAAPTHG